MLLSAYTGHIVAVCESFAEADEVSLETVVVVRTGKVKTEAYAYVVDDEDHAVVIAELADCSPLFLRCADIVVEVAVVVRLGNDTRYVTVVLVIDSLKSFHVEPGNDYVVCNFLRKNAGIVGLLCPLEITVIVALEEYNLLFACMRTCAHYGKCSGVRTVLHEEGPVRTVDRIFKEFGTLYHLVRDRCCAVTALELLDCRGIYIVIAVAQYVRAVCAHIVDVAVAVNIPEICAFCVIAHEGPFCDGKEKTF